MKNILLRDARLKKNWSQKQLADFAGISLSTIERAERGEPLRIDNIQRICECLNKGPQELGLVQLEAVSPNTKRENKGSPLIITAKVSVNTIISDDENIMPS